MICHILRERLGVKIILALTATATRTTSDSIIQHLQIPDGKDGIISDKPLPDNLRLTVSKDGNKDMALLNLLLSDKFKDFRSIIVYCTRREECERIAAFLRTSLRDGKQIIGNNKKRKRLDVQAEPYHAGMSSSRRKTVQKAFMSGELRIVVATVAFGNYIFFKQSIFFTNECGGFFLFFLSGNPLNAYNGGSLKTNQTGCRKHVVHFMRHRNEVAT